MLVAPLVYVGDALLQSGRAREAVPYLERAAPLAALGDGANSRAAAMTTLVLGMCRAELGEDAAAGVLLERAFAISVGLARGDTLRFEVELALGRHLAKTGQAARGRAVLEEALRGGVANQELTAKARFALAQALPRAERKRARELADQARAVYARAGTRRAKDVVAIDAWLTKN